jgi:GNAT superfamily N-acetyltransferase
MKRLSRAGALKSQSGRSKRGALVGREFLPGVLIRRAPSRSILIDRERNCAYVTYRPTFESDSAIFAWSDADGKRASFVAKVGTPMGVEPTTRKRRRRRVSASPPRVSAKQAAESVVAAANAQRDVLRLVPERLRRLEGAELVGYRVSTMPESLRRWAFDLTKRNMFDAYERTWGWNNREKRRELAHADARFLVAHVRRTSEEREKDGVVKSRQKKACENDERDDRDASSSALAFAHVRFEVEADEKPVVYAYELQCDGLKDAMRKGYGRFLMRAAEAAGATAGCTRSVLTVLKENAGARLFYQAMGYETDPATPTEASCVYVILRKELKRGSACGEESGRE